MKRQYYISALIALSVSLLVVFGNEYLSNKDNKTIKIEHINSTAANKVLYSLNEDGNIKPLDFTKTAGRVVNSVVHIKSSIVMDNNYSQQYQYRQLPDPFRDFFGNDDAFRHFFGPQQQNRQNYNRRPNVQQASGSGVIINSKGYIVTNNHVIENAQDIEVTLHDNRSYKAVVVGTDPSTDLALLQIKEKDLPVLPFVNSDDVKVGEWVLAVGNPFSLNSTVTAGIISAKARNINILKEQYAVESFIQTDAAINPGNSGGALINLDGGLIGINTAIASPTGSYSGYGFAIPSNIVNKVVEDLLKYGVVQRGVLGIAIHSVDANIAKEKDLDITTGVYVDSLLANSAANEAGIKQGDVIIAIDNEEISSSPKLQEVIAKHSPGDKINITVNRKGKEKEFMVTLNNRKGETDLLEKEHIEMLSQLGCEMKPINSKSAKKLGIKGGVRIEKIFAGKLRQQTRIHEGFIITHINNQEVSTIKDVAKILNGKQGGVMLAGIYEDLPGIYYYAIGL